MNSIASLERVLEVQGKEKTDLADTPEKKAAVFDNDQVKEKLPILPDFHAVEAVEMDIGDYCERVLELLRANGESEFTESEIVEHACLSHPQARAAIEVLLKQGELYESSPRHFSRIK